MKRLREDGEGAVTTGNTNMSSTGVTQVSNVDAGKIDIFGSKPKNVDDVYNKLFELDDYKKESVTNDKTQFAGEALTLAKSFSEMANDEFMSKNDKTLFANLAKIIKERFKQGDSITILKTNLGYKILLNIDM